MLTHAQFNYPRARMLRHPGPFNPVRIQSMRHQSGRHIRLLLAPGLSLYEAVVSALYEANVTSASMTILGGQFRHLQYCVAPPDEQKKTVIAYSPPISAGAAHMIFGNATLGRDIAGAPLVHCHASICDGHGEVRGGHILPGESFIAERPISVLVTALEGFELRQSFDEETSIPMLKPAAETSHE